MLGAARPMTLSRRGCGRVLAVAAAVAALVLAPAPAASAHPLGNVSVNHFTGLLLADDHALAEHIVDLAEIPTTQLGGRIDDLEQLAGDECATVAGDLRLEVGGTVAPFAVTDATASTADGQAGLTVTRVSCLLRAEYPPIESATTVRLDDEIGGSQQGWREITARGDGTTLIGSSVATSSISDRLTDYPSDLLESPLDIRSATVTVEPGGPVGVLEGAGEAAAGPGGAAVTLDWAAGLTDRVAGMLDNGGVAWLVLALVAALGVGAVHALAPGHGKTLLAMYLVGGHTRSVRDALRVGLTVTAAHTASVLALGVLVAAGSSVVPDRVYPVLTAVSGLLVLWLGIGLLRRARQPRTAHAHSHAPAVLAHAHSAAHAHGDTRPPEQQVHPHAHPHAHPHGHDRAGQGSPSRGGLVALGIAGGVVPSPSAVLLLVAAVGLGRPWFGALLVLVFGVGMALTLCAVGLTAADVIARLGSLASRRAGWARVTRLTVTYGGAAGVCAIGAALVLRSALAL